VGDGDLLFAAYAGWLSDRFAKKNVMIVAKGCEIVAMGLGAIGLIYLNWWLILAMAWFMATQSSIFSPAVNGMIPKHYSPERVNRANAVIKIAIMAGILIGVGMAGAVLGGLSTDSGTASRDPAKSAKVLVAAIVIAITLIAFALSFLAPWYPPADPKRKFPTRGPLETVKLLWSLRKDRLFKITLCADTTSGGWVRCRYWSSMKWA
jgi:MFS family permease